MFACFRYQLSVGFRAGDWGRRTKASARSRPSADTATTSTPSSSRSGMSCCRLAR